ncbi:uncharacterized protein LOC126160062 [Schistocerca cancellata]|uniref:uncharacterized protein LOC126160062 n=1 Tax=Schistocerca cancellata TaxID=274614 RepID=UPI00211996EC|nr:uncharacterized protein LOC126160062 [Schistocerca cancellata]
MGGTSAYPSGSTAQSSQATERTVVRKSYACKVKETLDEMAQLLDIPPEVRAELTDEDIVAMSIKFIKKMTAPDGVSQPRDPDKDIPLDTYLAVLDGFVLHLGRSGKVQYISQNELINQSVDLSLAVNLASALLFGL